MLCSAISAQNPIASNIRRLPYTETASTPASAIQHAGYDLYVDLDALSGILHLLVRLGRVLLLRAPSSRLAVPPGAITRHRLSTQLACIPRASQPRPQLDNPQLRVAPAHVSDQLQFLLLGADSGDGCGAVVTGTGQAIPCVPSYRFSPEVDVGAALVVLPAGAGHAVFFCVLASGSSGIAHPVLYCP